MIDQVKAAAALFAPIREANGFLNSSDHNLAAYSLPCMQSMQESALPGRPGRGAQSSFEQRRQHILSLLQENAGKRQHARPA